MGRVGVYAAHLPAVAGDGFPQLGQTRGGAVMRITFLKGLNSSVDYVLGSIKIRLADFQVDDFLALSFQRPSFGQDFESGFGAQILHSVG